MNREQMIAWLTLEGATLNEPYYVDGTGAIKNIWVLLCRGKEWQTWKNDMHWRDGREHKPESFWYPVQCDLCELSDDFLCGAITALEK